MENQPARSEFGAGQSALAPNIDVGSKPRLLVILENFEGWERGADWGNDLDFLFVHSSKISKIAIVAEPRWEPLALAFAGPGSAVRRSSFFRLTNSIRREAGWRNRRAGSGGTGESDCAIPA